MEGMFFLVSDDFLVFFLFFLRISRGFCCWAHEIFFLILYMYRTIEYMICNMYV